MGLRVPASCVPHVPEAQGSLPPGRDYCTYDVRVPTTGGHYCLDGTACDNDPWAGVTYTSDASGNAEVDLRIADFSLVDGMPVAGRALVIHDGDAGGKARIGCGVISPTTAQITVIGRYPKHVGGLSVKGLLALRPVGTGLEIQGSLVGVAPSETAGATAP